MRVAFALPSAGPWLFALGWLLAAGGLGCATRTPAVDPAPARFAFPADTFAFANQLLWTYEPDPATGQLVGTPRDPEPDFTFQCGPMARAARQFYWGARFEPATPPLDDAGYDARVRALFDTSPRHPPDSKVVIPGYADLRSFSAAHEALLKAALMNVWPNSMQRGNWRLLFPFWPDEQRALAERIQDELARGWLPIVHLVLFPERSINHLVLVFAAETTKAEIRFLAYDANFADHAITLVYDRAARTFAVPPMPFFPGGVVKAYEVYDGLWY